MRTWLISLLFQLIGESKPMLRSIGHLFGVPGMNHAARARKWEKALQRLWNDKDLLDFLYYQAESDKENIFRGRVNPDMARGARVRTLFIVYQAQLAHQRFVMQAGKNAEHASSFAQVAKQLSSTYKGIVDVK